jgi:hypothetical protein
VDLENASKLFSDGNMYFMVTAYGKTSTGSFSLTSDAGVDGGTLPIGYTCDGAGDSPALFWSNPPDGTKKLPDTADQITGEVLTEAISKITIGSASLNLNYTRAF